jgi:ABC-type uncharacterized transport system substrate-binding protein
VRQFWIFDFGFSIWPEEIPSSIPLLSIRQSKIGNPKWWGIFAFALTFAFGEATAHAQQTKNIPRIGYLSAAFPSTSPARVKAFLQGLRELGYTEGKNIVIEYRYAAGKLERLPALAAELVQLKVDIIVSAASSTTRAAKEATATIPIVMTNDNNPVDSGFVASLARPSGNITGLANFNPELSGKRLELLKEIIPTLTRVAAFGTSTSPDTAQSLRELDLAAKALGVKLQYLDVLSPRDIETAFRAATKGRADALVVLPSGVVNAHRTQIVELALRSRLPATYPNNQWMETGGLMTYAVSRTDLDRRAAIYVDKILKGTTPADLPVEQPTKFEFVINLKTAKQIGLTIPPNVLARADRVIR